ncbi:MAG: ATP-dependent RNA helicase HrpA [Planctomycetes bacterium]|nr:ATP-dependent RNA helicase HrpA [Planctomycetota bacterium]
MVLPEKAHKKNNQTPLPEITFPEELPISGKRELIAKAIQENQVVIVAGETGSGKTTQIPKICLELGRGTAGMIGCTQPRRIAAISVAERVSEELGRAVGSPVGYQIRFESKINKDACIKFMTDGILLSEINHDRKLLAYDTIMIDEVHERTINIDFLLGYLKQLLPTRPDLKVIVSSATLDVERFSDFFDQAPVIRVEGRTFPVELRYRPPDERDDDPDLPALVAEAVKEIYTEDSGPPDKTKDESAPAHDILVFLPSEQSIRECLDLLTGQRIANTEILPLFGRLTASEQRQVFHPGKARRIILSTNVAETSVTVPRIRYVIDTGTARVRRFNLQTQVEHLLIEPISRASAEQRKGRCGRVAPGVCIRLFSEDDYSDRPDYTDPEILRSSLASVILQMKSMHLGEVESFPFIQPPEALAVRRGYAELAELGAIDENKVLTQMGRRMSRLPLEPRFSRILLAADRRNTLEEVLILVAVLSIQDPRHRPLDKQEEADQIHKEFLDDRSDFIGWLKLWRFFDEARRTLPSNNQLRRFCKKNFLSYMRMREWRNIREQLAEEMRRLHKQIARKRLPQIKKATPYEALHRALLAGLLSHIGLADQEKKNYRGAHGTRFRIFPGSGLFHSMPKWIMGAEVLETSALYARSVAVIEPEWIEKQAHEICKRSYSEPHWEARTGHVRAYEQVTVYGLPVVERRRVHYGKIAPEESRQIFIQHALVEGDVRRKLTFLEANQKLIAEVIELQHQARRNDLLVNAEALFDFYEQRLPEGICSLREIEQWFYQEVKGNPNLLLMRREDVQLQMPNGITIDRFPLELELPSGKFPLKYAFAPGEPEDGVTCTLPVGLLAHVEEWRFEWLVPGLLGEKIAMLIRALPRGQRREFVPVPDTVEACLVKLPHGEEPLPVALSKVLRKLKGVMIAPEEWRLDELPAFLRMNFKVVDKDGRILKTGRELQVLRTSLQDATIQQFQHADKRRWEREGLTKWDFGDLPLQVQLGLSGSICYGFPALCDEGDSVSIRLYEDPKRAGVVHREGLHRLFAINLAPHKKSLYRSMPISERALMYFSTLGESLASGSTATAEKLRNAIVDKAIFQVFLRKNPSIREEKVFNRYVEDLRAPVHKAAYDLAGAVDKILIKALELNQVLRKPEKNLPTESVLDLREQLRQMVYPEFISETPFEKFFEMPRYLEAMEVRLEQLRSSPHKDRGKMERVMAFWQPCLEKLEEFRKNSVAIPDGMAGCLPPGLIAFRWLVEEYRVSIFAQKLGTSGRVSDKKLRELWQTVEKEGDFY